MRNPLRPQRPGPAPAQPAAPAPSRPAAGGGSTGGGEAHGFSRSRFDEMSLARFIRVLPEVGDELAQARAATSGRISATASSVRARAASADESQPISQAVAAELYSIAAQMARIEEETANRMRQLESRAAALQPMARRNNEGDLTRAEAPRKGSHGVEEKADNRAARRDT